MGGQRNKYSIRFHTGQLERSVELDSEEGILGRGDDAQVKVDAPEVSRHHAKILVRGRRVYVQDLGSANGTFVGGRRLRAHEEAELTAPQLEFSLGRHVHVFFEFPATVAAPKHATVTALASTAQPTDSLNRLLETERKHLYDRIDGLKSEVAELLDHRKKLTAEKASAKKEIEEVLLRLRVEKIDLEKEILRSRENLEAELDANARELQTRQERHRELSAQLISAEAEMKEKIIGHEIHREELRAQKEALEGELTRERVQLDSAKQEQAECHREVTQLKAEAESAHQQLRREQEETERLRTEKEGLLTSIHELKAQSTALAGEHAQAIAELEGERATTRHERELRELEDRRQRALSETMTAELQAKRASLESGLAKCRLEQANARRELQETKDRVSTEERGHRAITEKIAALRADLERGERAIAEQKRQNENFSQEEKKLETNLVKLRAEEKEVDASIARNRRDLMNIRAELEAEATREKEKVAGELRAKKEAGEAEFATERKRKHLELEKEFTQKAQAMELDLATAKLSKLAELEKIGDEKAALAKSRRDLMTNEIVRSAVALSVQGPLSSRESEFRQIVATVLEGKSVSTANAQIISRTRRFWAKAALAISVPALAAVTLYLFPEIPDFFAQKVNRKIASEKKEGSVFLQAIQEKGMKYQPVRDAEYRNSYTENLLYLDGYAELKRDEEEKKKWILVLNDFFVGRLQLGDRIIPNFIATESIMMRNLTGVRETMLPQFKEQSLARMAEIEKNETSKLITLLKGEANYRQFRDLEKKFHQGYLTRRAPASSP